MKNITKFFGACAAVALFSACSSEEDLAGNQGQVPEGMHEVFLTVNKEQSADESGKKRVYMDKDGSRFTWANHDDIAVIYRNLHNESQWKIVQFTEYEPNGGQTWGTFRGLVDGTTWSTMAPVDVYSHHTGSFMGTETEEDYKTFSYVQKNVEENLVSADMNSEYNMHLHGKATASGNSGFTDHFVDEFTATLSLDIASLVCIDKDDLPEAKQGEWPIWYYTIKTTVGEQEYTYTINCTNENNNLLNNKPKEALTFFVKVPEDGIENPQFIVEGAGGATKTFTTANDAQTNSPKKLEAAKRYKLVLEAPASTTKGTAKATIGGNQVDVPWVQLWDDGPKFAAYNVGVTDGNEESSGGYYCWGGTYENGSQFSWDGLYNTGTDVLTGSNDTATNLWGSAWRMPTLAELQALLGNCDVAWTANYNESGVKGRIFTGKGDYVSNSVFLPAAGYCRNGSVGDQGDYGNYWSSTPVGSSRACYLRFLSGDQGVSSDYRYFGFSVRAVLAE